MQVEKIQKTAIAETGERLTLPVASSAVLKFTHVGTDVFAEAVFVAAETVLKAHSQHGNYMGIRPVRLPNRKLAWPIAEIEKLFHQSGNTFTREAA